MMLALRCGLQPATTAVPITSCRVVVPLAGDGAAYALVADSTVTLWCPITGRWPTGRLAAAAAVWDSLKAPRSSCCGTPCIVCRYRQILLWLRCSRISIRLSVVHIITTRSVVVPVSPAAAFRQLPSPLLQVSRYFLKKTKIEIVRSKISTVKHCCFSND